MTKISAIVTSFNVEAFIATALQSVIDAGFEDLELIVVDDGSSDATRQVADVVISAASIDRIRYVPIYFSRNTPGGVASAANAGLDQATGDVVVFVDGDDWVDPFHLARAVHRHLSCNPDVTICGCKEYWNDTGAYTNYPESHVWDLLPESHNIEVQRDLVLQMAPFPWRKIYSRRFIERFDIRFPVGSFFYEDNPFHWETTLRASKFSFYRSVTHVHRMARSGQTVSNMDTRPLRIFDHARTIRGSLIASGKEKELSARYLHWLLDHILWCARYVPPQALNELYDLSIEATEDVNVEMFWASLNERPRTVKEIRRLSAVCLRDRMGFLREF